MKKTLLAALTASLLSVNSYCIDGDAGVLINEAQNQNVSEEDLKTIFELKAESIRLTEQIKQEMAASSVSNDVDERSLLIQSKKALYELKETMDPETYERLITSLTEQEKSAADSSFTSSAEDMSLYPVYIFASQAMGDSVSGIHLCITGDGGLRT